MFDHMEEIDALREDWSSVFRISVESVDKEMANILRRFIKLLGHGQYSKVDLPKWLPLSDCKYILKRLQLAEGKLKNKQNECEIPKIGSYF